MIVKTPGSQMGSPCQGPEHGVHKAGSNWLLHFSRRSWLASGGVACKASRATRSGKSCDHVGRWRVSHDSVLCDAVRSNRRRLPPLAHSSSWCSARLLQGSPAAVQLCALRWCVLLTPTVSTFRGGLHWRFGVAAKAHLVRGHISSSVTGNGSFGPSIRQVCWRGCQCAADIFIAQRRVFSSHYTTCGVHPSLPRRSASRAATRPTSLSDPVQRPFPFWISLGWRSVHPHALSHSITLSSHTNPLTHIHALSLPFSSLSLSCPLARSSSLTHVRAHTHNYSRTLAHLFTQTAHSLCLSFICSLSYFLFFACTLSIADVRMCAMSHFLQTHTHQAHQLLAE